MAGQLVSTDGKPEGTIFKESEAFAQNTEAVPEGESEMASTEKSKTAQLINRIITVIKHFILQ